MKNILLPLLSSLKGLRRNRALLHLEVLSLRHWYAVDLERRLTDYQAYYNQHRTHRSLGGDTPAEVAGVVTKLPIKLNKFRW